MLVHYCQNSKWSSANLLRQIHITTIFLKLYVIILKYAIKYMLDINTNIECYIKYKKLLCSIAMNVINFEYYCYKITDRKQPVSFII